MVSGVGNSTVAFRLVGNVLLIHGVSVVQRRLKGAPLLSLEAGLKRGARLIPSLLFLIVQYLEDVSVIYTAGAFYPTSSCIL